MAGWGKPLAGFRIWAMLAVLPIAAILPLAAEANVCGDAVLMHWPAGGSICVTEDLVDELGQYGFYVSDIPLPTVNSGGLLTHTCSVGQFMGGFTGFEGDVMMDSFGETSMSVSSATTAQSFSSASTASPEYSTTNIQEAEVDEPDIVKNTATDIFVSGDHMNVVRAYPPENAYIAGYSLTTGTMLLHGDKLAVFETAGDTRITILDVSDRASPQIIDHAIITGSMLEARLTNGTIYVVTRDSVDRQPTVRYGSDTISPPTHYFPNYPAQVQTMISAVSLESGLTDAVSFLTSFDTVVYASGSSIYLVMPGLGYTPAGGGCSPDTQIIKIGISGASLSYGGDGTVPGYPIDQFAMSERDDTFRIATTTRDGVNSAYKMNEKLEIVGSVEDIAPRETMHSARFYGDTLYLVTFRQVDPFFVIDFSGDPEVLGELKLPGFSEYLHPYDERTIFGVGRETIEGQWGPVLDGVKLTVFDVSDPADPALSDFAVIGDRYAYSQVQYDHKAALVSERIISIPVTQDRTTTFHAYNIEDGFLVKRGTVQHDGDSWARSLYIGDYLYTVTPGTLKITDLDGFTFVKQVNLD